jgi:hypothetical protein
MSIPCGSRKSTFPGTLQDAILYFASPDNCRQYLVAHRWPSDVTCPRCGSTKVIFRPKYNRWQCSSKHALRQFTSQTGTIFEDSPLGLDKWLLAMWQVVNLQKRCKFLRDPSRHKSYAKNCLVHGSQNPRSFGMAPADETGKFSGEVEADETFVGGKMANMRPRRQAKLRAVGCSRGGVFCKAIVSGLLDRNTKKARVKEMGNVRQFGLRTNIAVRSGPGA